MSRNMRQIENELERINDIHLISNMLLLLSFFAMVVGLIMTVWAELIGLKILASGAIVFIPTIIFIDNVDEKINLLKKEKRRLLLKEIE